MRAILYYSRAVSVQQPARGIGTLRCHVIDVDDLAVGETFWSEVTGLPIIGSGWTGRFSYLGRADPWKGYELTHQLRRSLRAVRRWLERFSCSLFHTTLIMSMLGEYGMGRPSHSPSTKEQQEWG